MSPIFQSIRDELTAYSNPKRVEFSKNYFPPEPHQKPDIFYGGTVPQTRSVAVKYKDIDYPALRKLINSNVHEERLCALMILKIKTDTAIRAAKYNELDDIKGFYLRNIDQINHWDLVDETAHRVLGAILVFWSKELLHKIKDFRDQEHGYPTLEGLASSDFSVWHKRISIVAMFAWIKAGNLDVPISMCQFHIDNRHHYIQKAVGWVLREIGKNDKEKLDEFLLKNINEIGATALSYALEKHTVEEKIAIKKTKLKLVS